MFADIKGPHLDFWGEGPTTFHTALQHGMVYLEFQWFVGGVGRGIEKNSSVQFFLKKYFCKHFL